MRRVGKYEVGRTIGEGTFAKVKFAVHKVTAECFAIKVLDKNTVLRNKMVEQIKREVSIMKMVRHPNVVRLHEVLASRVKIYIVLELASGGELFDRIVRRIIFLAFACPCRYGYLWPWSRRHKREGLKVAVCQVHQGRLSEEESRRYFQQLIDAVDFCHSKGVSHRDLKPENLLLDANGNLKVSDFGLSALPHQVREDGLLHTTCGTPNYVAPEVLENKGYDGAVADIWSCGVILFVLMAGYIPFNEADLTTLYNKIQRASFSCPSWFSPSAKSLLLKILDPNPQIRISVEGIRNHKWFKKNYVPVRVIDVEQTTDLDDVESVFDDSEENFVDEEALKDPGPQMMNAFELITLSQGLNLSALFDRRQDHVKRHTRFTSNRPAKEIISRMEAIAQSMGFRVETHGYKMRLEGRGAGRIVRQLAVAIEVFEMAPTLFMVEVRKAMGDILDYHKFYKSFYGRLKDIVCKTIMGMDRRNTVL